MNDSGYLMTMFLLEVI